MSVKVLRLLPNQHDYGIVERVTVYFGSKPCLPSCTKTVLKMEATDSSETMGPFNTTKGMALFREKMKV
jgi:hypothetical protein